MSETQKHVQQTLLSMGDEFLVQYLLCAHKEFRATLILSRLFSMGHSLELYLKAALVDVSGIPPHGHDIPRLINQFDNTLALSSDEVAAGVALFDPNCTNFDLGLYQKHTEAMELYQAEYHTVNLKYYLAKDNKVIFPARHSLSPANLRYLRMAHKIRSTMPYKDAHQDEMLLQAVALIGFEYNLAEIVVHGSKL